MEVARAEEVQSLAVDPPTKENEVTEIPPEFLIKHPLENVWTLWYFEQIKGMGWEECQKEITSFDTVEDFWSVYNHIKPASEIKQGSDYSIFKSGIRPMWEDPANRQGGRWLINLEKKQRYNDLDKYWLDVCLCLIGEAFENADDVCGAVVNIRTKQDKIALWTADATRSVGIMEIGKKLKEKLKVRSVMVYQLHSNSQKSGSTIKNTFTL